MYLELRQRPADADVGELLKVGQHLFVCFTQHPPLCRRFHTHTDTQTLERASLCVLSSARCPLIDSPFVPLHPKSPLRAHTSTRTTAVDQSIHVRRRQHSMVSHGDVVNYNRRCHPCAAHVTVAARLRGPPHRMPAARGREMLYRHRARMERPTSLSPSSTLPPGAAARSS